MRRTIVVVLCFAWVTAGGCERIRQEAENNRISKAVAGSWVLDDISDISDDVGDKILGNLVCALVELKVELTLSDDGTFYKRQGFGVSTGKWSVKAGFVQTGENSWADASYVQVGDERYRYQGGRLILVTNSTRTVLKRK